jgi:predicted dehydrogenase/threonine dehydrogenase-like Zn-dependent dehydrogenase
MKQLLVRKGAVGLSEVPAPTVGARNILVRVENSCVSIGTEMAGVRMSGMPLWKRAIKQPHHARKVVQLMRDQGVKRVWDRVSGMLASGTPTGYSAAGEVVAVGDLVEGFTVGDRVACAGAGIANHAEYIDVPVNLSVRLPAGLSSELGCTVTLGAIAMQGVRRAAPTLGETFVVVGMGILGQITDQLLRAHGCRVIGTDIDSARLEVARQCGMQHGLSPSDGDCAEAVRRLTSGIGADGVIVTAAATENHEIMAMAMRCCRRKGRVVIVGDVGLNLQRHEFFGKELDVLISASYGPGRYDPSYEVDGQDYPLAYVRWTENRNMEEYLRLLAEGRVSLQAMKPQVFELARAPEAYQALAAPGPKPMLVLLSYPGGTGAPPPSRTIRVPGADPTVTGSIGVAIVGAGGFAQGMHLPNFAKLRGSYQLRTICSRTGSNALAAAKQFGVPTATTDFGHVLADPAVQLVVLCTRHDLHGTMALRALRAGKHVLCEKPLALLDAEIDEIERFYAEPGERKPVLMVGFNRRWSPAFVRLRQILAGRQSPIMAQYVMNAGYIPLDHWVHGPEGGGRNVGEACHIYDLFFALAGAACVDIQMAGVPRQGRQWARNDNFSASLSFADGSVCTLLYTAMGAKQFPKERLQVFSEGRVLVLDDYRRLDVSGSPAKGWSSVTQDKGQLAEIEALAGMIRSGAPEGFIEEQLAVSRMTLEAERRLMRREVTID